jgi:hypothetical protein
VLFRRKSRGLDREMSGVQESLRTRRELNGELNDHDREIRCS